MKRTSIGLSLLLSCLVGVGHASENAPGVLFMHPSPSPDGSKVVFESDLASPASPLNLWIENINGSSLHKVTQNAGVELDPAWSPDGTRIAYATGIEGALDIWLVNPDGSGALQLTRNSLNNAQPAWSPDGKQIVFVSNRGGTNDLWLMNSDGTAQTRLTTLPGQENHPSFSPDGKSIVFSETMSGLAQLMVVSVAGTIPPVAITSPGFNDWNPQWSSKGIIFASNRDTTSEHWKIWTVQPDGSGLIKLGDVVALDPVWTTNNQVLFSDEIGGPANESATVTLLNASTGTKSVLTNVSGYVAAIEIVSSTTPPLITPGATGTLRVAILSTASFAAPTAVDTKTLTFGRTGMERSFVSCDTTTSDVNKDGIQDLVCTFDLTKAGFLAGDTNAVMNFSDLQGNPYQGGETITTISTGCQGSVLIDFSKGFSAAGLTLNGGASIVGNALQLTDGKTFEARSAFFSTEVPVASFVTDFSFQLTNAEADGFAFVVQADSPKALGGNQGGLGYSGIPYSAALKFDLFNNYGEGTSSTGFFLNGAFPATPSINLLPQGIDLHSGHIFAVHMVYDGTTVKATITDTTTNATYSVSDKISAMAQSQKLYVGFTGGTGRLSATQNILSWSFTNTASCLAKVN